MPELSDLDRFYLSALKREHTKATENGRPELAKILDEEAERIESGKGVPRTDSAQTPIELQKLRDVWRRENAQGK